MLYSTPSMHTEIQQIIKNKTNQDYNLLKNGTHPKIINNWHMMQQIIKNKTNQDYNLLKNGTHP